MTRDSIKASPRMKRALIEPAEPGFLEIPSKAALIALLWAMAPAMADKVKPPMLIITAQTSLSELDEPSLAKRGERKREKIKNLLMKFPFFDIFIIMIYFHFNVLLRLLHQQCRSWLRKQKQEPV